MKTVVRSLGRTIRLGTMLAALLLGQQALAAGTTAGTDVTNDVTVSYEVNGNTQTDLTDSVTFEVDRRVNFSVTRVLATLPIVTPGDTDDFIEFIVANDGNSPLDFNLVLDVLANGVDARPGQPATGVSMANVEIAVSTAFDGVGTPGAGPDPARGDGTAITALPEDNSIRVRVFADTPLTLVQGDLAGLRLNATAALGGSALTETAGPDVQNQVDNVFENGPDTNGNATESDTDGFEVESAALAVTKVATTLEDPITGVSADAKPIPGAIVEYVVTLDNSTGSQDASAVALQDFVDLDVVLRNGDFNGGASNVAFSDGSFCNADDAADTDGDGCSFDAGTGELNITVPDVTAGNSIDVSYRVDIL